MDARAGRGVRTANPPRTPDDQHEHQRDPDASDRHEYRRQKGACALDRSDGGERKSPSEHPQPEEEQRHVEMVPTLGGHGD